MYVCKPERNATQAKIMVLAFAVVTALLFLVGSFDIPYASLLRLLGFVSLAVALNTVVRYCITEFEYVISGGSFSIVKTTGNRKQTVCNVALETAIDLMEKRDYDHLPSAEKAVIKYSLNQNIKAKSYVFLCEFNGKRAMIEFEPNEAFVSIMKNEIALNKK